MNVRPAEATDSSALASLHISRDLESRHEGPDETNGWRIKTLSSRARDIVLVTEEDGEVCGYLWAVAIQLFDYRIGIIFDMFVPPEHRLKGIGKQMLKNAMTEFRKMGVHRFWANTEAHNGPMCALLESFNFKPTPDKVFFDLKEAGAGHDWEQV